MAEKENNLTDADIAKRFGLSPNDLAAFKKNQVLSGKTPPGPVYKGQLMKESPDQRLERSGLTWEDYVEAKEAGETDVNIANHYNLQQHDIGRFRKIHEERGEKMPPKTPRYMSGFPLVVKPTPTQVPPVHFDAIRRLQDEIDHDKRTTARKEQELARLMRAYAESLERAQ